jgi:uncharacterized protein YbcI
MDKELMKRLEGNVAWSERTMLSVSEAREIVNALRARPDNKKIKELESRIGELEAEILSLQDDLAEAWAMVVPL